MIIILTCLFLDSSLRKYQTDIVSYFGLINLLWTPLLLFSLQNNILSSFINILLIITRYYQEILLDVLQTIDVFDFEAHSSGIDSSVRLQYMFVKGQSSPHFSTFCSFIISSNDISFSTSCSNCRFVITTLILHEARLFTTIDSASGLIFLCFLEAAFLVTHKVLPMLYEEKMKWRVINRKQFACLSWMGC